MTDKKKLELIRRIAEHIDAGYSESPEAMQLMTDIVIMIADFDEKEETQK